jgi:serine/threonine protein kinase
MSDLPSSANGRGALVAGKYEVIRLIGRGGMGSVWEGRHASLGTRVAIKFVDAEHADNDEARSRFVTEARAAAAIQSKHAIQIFDHGVTDDGRPYMVMELLVGEPLDVRIERLGRLSLAETARILAQVCRALARAHEAGIIHRDLKPENIFLVRSVEDEDEIAKVLDFGIAKIRIPFQGSEPTSSTDTGAVIGTPYYMSPEQARGLRTIDHRTDLWSLGVIAYKCVTGVLPFEGQSVGDLLVKICTDPLPTPSAVASDVPAAFDAWFARALDREPAARFTSAAELADALATAAGTVLRRSASIQETTLPGPPAARAPFEPSWPATPLPSPGPGANSTSAPFTAPAAPARASRGAIAGVTVASIVAASVGIVAIARFVPREAATRTATSAATVLAPPSALADAFDSAATVRPAATPSGAPATVPASAALPVVGSSVPAPASSTRLPTPSGPERPAPPLVHAAEKPQTATKIAAPASVHPAPRPTSSADPGY